MQRNWVFHHNGPLNPTPGTCPFCHPFSRRKSTVIYFGEVLTHNPCKPLSSLCQKGAAPAQEAVSDSREVMALRLGIRQHTVLVSTQPDRKGEDLA